MEEETQTKEKVETDMEEENKNTVATTTMKTRGGMIILQNGNAKIVVHIIQEGATNRWDGSMTQKTLKLNITKRVVGETKIK